MKLRYIGLRMKTNLRDSKYSSDFGFHTYFIWHCLSKEVRKLKFETDGTFDAVFINVGAEATSFKIINLSLVVSMPFDFDFYDNATQDQKYQYYLALYHEGLQIASRYKNIPLEEVNNIIQSLVDNNFIYSWKFKNLRVPEYNLKIKLTCFLSTDDFILKLEAFRNKELKPVCEGIVIRTMPDDMDFSFISSDVQINNGRICFYFKSGTEVLSIRLKNIVEGNLIIDYSEAPYPDNPKSTETFYYLQNLFKYDNYDFISARQE